MADLHLLRRKQGFWETPRNMVILLSGVVMIVGVIVSVVSFQIGRDLARSLSRPQIIIQIAPPAAEPPK